MRRSRACTSTTSTSRRRCPAASWGTTCPETTPARSSYRRPCSASATRTGATTTSSTWRAGVSHTTSKNDESYIPQSSFFIREASRETSSGIMRLWGSMECHDLPVFKFTIHIVLYEQLWARQRRRRGVRGTAAEQRHCRPWGTTSFICWIPLPQTHRPVLDLRT